MRRFMLALPLTAMPMISLASEKPSLDDAQAQLKTSFSSLSIVDFSESPIPDIYEVNTGNGIIYYHPKKDIIFFGEMYDKSGESLTQASLAKAMKSNLEKLPADYGIQIGDKDGIEIIEFTDPDCPYCREYEKFITQLSEEKAIKRTIYFDTRIHPGSLDKVTHIICSENQEEAFHDIYSGKTMEYKQCDQAAEILAAHLRVSEGLGVSGTPTFILGDKLSPGFRPGAILEYVNEQKRK